MVLLRNREYNEPRVLTVKPAAPEFNLTGQFCHVLKSERDRKELKWRNFGLPKKNISLKIPSSCIIYFSRHCERKECNKKKIVCTSIFIHTGVQDFLPDCQPSPMTDSGLSSSSTSSSISLGAGGTALSHLSPTFLSEVDVTAEQDEKVKSLIEFITSRWVFPIKCYLHLPQSLLVLILQFALTC